MINYLTQLMMQYGLTKLISSALSEDDAISKLHNNLDHAFNSRKNLTAQPVLKW